MNPKDYGLQLDNSYYVGKVKVTAHSDGGGTWFDVLGGSCIPRNVRRRRPMPTYTTVNTTTPSSYYFDFEHQKWIRTNIPEGGSSA